MQVPEICMEVESQEDVPASQEREFALVLYASSHGNPATSFSARTLTHLFARLFTIMCMAHTILLFCLASEIAYARPQSCRNTTGRIAMFTRFVNFRLRVGSRQHVHLSHGTALSF